MKLYTPISFNCINSDPVLTGKPVERSDAASPDFAPDADSIIDALVKETLAEWDALGYNLSADDAVAQHAPTRK